MIIQLFFFIFIMLLMAAILLHTETCVVGAASGLIIWFDSVLPSLFPFMVLTGLVIRMNLLGVLSHKLCKHRIFRRLPVSPVFAVITGLLCGYPMGIRTVSDLKNTGQLSKKQASLLISFVNQPGPMFIMGFALPLCGLTGKQNLQFMLAFYGGVALTALLSAVNVHIFPRRNSSARAETDNTATTPSPVPGKSASVFQLFEETILSSMVTLTKIGGYMMLFSLITALMKDIFPRHPDVLLILGGILEMTSGIANIAISGQTYAPYFVLAFLSFGGLCVTAQSFSLGGLTTSEQLKYLFWKSVQTILSVCLFYLINTYFTY